MVKTTAPKGHFQINLPLDFELQVQDDATYWALKRVLKSKSRYLDKKVAKISEI